MGTFLHGCRHSTFSLTWCSYVDYATANWPANLEMGTENYTKKSDAFFTYAKHDRLEVRNQGPAVGSDTKLTIVQCQSWADCVSKGVGEAFWLQRQYHIGDSV